VVFIEQFAANFAEAQHRRSQGLPERRLELGDRPVSNTVARVIVFEIGSVFPPGDPRLPGGSDEIRLGNPEQGTAQENVLDASGFVHPGHAEEAGAPAEPHQNRFHLVVRGMRQEQVADAVLSRAV
jgi:hypothetical protein